MADAKRNSKQKAKGSSISEKVDGDCPIENQREVAKAIKEDEVDVPNHSTAGLVSI